MFGGRIGEAPLDFPGFFRLELADVCLGSSNSGEPLALAPCAAVLRIPTTRSPRRDVGSLDVAEVTAILAQPDRSSLEGQWDHALLALLYNTGARIQEALE